MSASPLDTWPALPPLSEAEREHSERVAAHLARVIAAADGWISFADYMQAVLYAPGLGYYAAGARKLGVAGDFLTAPELTPLFGYALASQLAQVLTQVGGGEIIEMGPGSGALAVDVLSALAKQNALPSRYRLLEVSPDLRQRQRDQLAARAPGALPRVEWLDALPEKWHGAILANEVLDAIPPHLVARRGGEWFERGVTIDATSGLAFSDRPLAPGPLRDLAQGRFPAQGDYASELNPAMEALLKTLAERCERGLLLAIDYGFPAAEYYHPQRTGGTLMAHHRHRALADPFFRPGMSDLTAHVDFSAAASAGVAGGMNVAGFAAQAQFLVACGVLDALAACGDPRSVPYLRAANAVQRLTSPAEMGELYKVLALTRGLEMELLGFRERDRRHRL